MFSYLQINVYLVIGLITGIIIGIPILNLYYGVMGQQPNEKFDNLPALWSAFIGYGRYFFYRSSKASVVKMDVDTLDYVLGVLAFLMILFRQMFAFMMEGLLLVGGVTL